LSAFDDLEDMVPLDLDVSTAELLIAGAVEFDDAPPGFDRVARLINKAQGPATADELTARTTIVSSFAARVRARRVVRPKTKRTLAFPKFPAKVLALVAPVVVLVGGVAAATDSLPPSAQAAVSQVLSSIGISVPTPQDDNEGIAGSTDSGTGSAAATVTGPDVGTRSPVAVRLCRAWRAGALNSHSTAYRNLAVAAGGAGNLLTYCAGATGSAAPIGAIAHAGKPSSAQLSSGVGVTKTSTTGSKKTLTHGARRMPAIPIRHSGAVVRGKAAASTSTPATATGRRGPKAPGTSQPPAVPSGPPAVSAGLLVPDRTHNPTASARSRGHRASTKAGQEGPQASKSSTQGKSGLTSPVRASPVLSSIPSGRGASQHHGQSQPSRRPRGCTHTRPGHIMQARQNCHAVTRAGPKKNATSTGPKRDHARPRRSGPSVGSQPRSVKHRKTT
jgi:hypothetical protein